MTEKNSCDDAEESTASVESILALAARCVGGTSALIRRLGMTYSELRTYMAGEAMPPKEMLSRAAKLVDEQRIASCQERDAR